MFQLFLFHSFLHYWIWTSIGSWALLTLFDGLWLLILIGEWSLIQRLTFITNYISGMPCGCWYYGHSSRCHWSYSGYRFSPNSQVECIHKKFTTSKNPPGLRRNACWLNGIKFIYSEKAKKFCKIFTLLLTVCTVVKSKVKISQNFVAFSEYMNFNR